MTRKELDDEILEILNNVYYWDTCPQEYNDRIDVIKKELNKKCNHTYKDFGYGQIDVCDKCNDWKWGE